MDWKLMKVMAVVSATGTLVEGSSVSGRHGRMRL